MYLLLLAWSCRAEDDAFRVVRTAEMSSPAWWEGHHVVAKLKAGQSWFAPLSLNVINALFSGKCLRGEAIVLGCGYSRTVERLTNHFHKAIGIDSSVTAIRAMRAARTTSRARFYAAETSRFEGSFLFVLDEGVYDLNRDRDYLLKAWSLVAPGGVLAIVGYAGSMSFANVTKSARAACVTSSRKIVPLEKLRHPELTCSPWRYGASLLYKL